MTLYIYRVGRLAPQEILLQDLNLLKTLVVLGPVRPDGPTGQTGFAGNPDEDPTNARPGGTPSGQAHFGLP